MKLRKDNELPERRHLLVPKEEREEDDKQQSSSFVEDFYNTPPPTFVDPYDEPAPPIKDLDFLCCHFS
ncbi:hypothetical protein LguiA_007239 [Lonicera macranthoides]